MPIGIPTADGGLEIPNRIFLGGIPAEVSFSIFFEKKQLVALKKLQQHIFFPYAVIIYHWILKRGSSRYSFFA